MYLGVTSENGKNRTIRAFPDGQHPFVIFLLAQRSRFRRVKLTFIVSAQSHRNSQFTNNLF
ncbi:hypothetical protein XBKQ1_360009 [Xenorhabdus bovienii str. kraussei Quebec]|uniref:Uncharacterized protein n=1 Tax=Xenorhabdus bovienii str. kraussei Quebec TaxID=1398203 RepID=A0A077PL67_XENBV|nr:hypothetical protein XBKQ1_360009 [Xenorhabdus bovienii str. kraussei Quebec]